LIDFKKANKPTLVVRHSSIKISICPDYSTLKACATNLCLVIQSFKRCFEVENGDCMLPCLIILPPREGRRFVPELILLRVLSVQDPRNAWDGLPSYRRSGISIFTVVVTGASQANPLTPDHPVDRALILPVTC